LSMQTNSTKKVKILDEIINNAIGLPIESQIQLLMMARAMRYTRDCIMRENSDEYSCNHPKQTA